MCTIKIELTVGDVNRLNDEIVIRLNLDKQTACVENGAAAEGQQLFPFIEELVKKKRACGKLRTADTYLSALRSFARFRGGCDMTMSELTSDVVMAYESSLLSDGLSLNTVSFYLRKLRAVYNLAVDEGLVSDRQPFRKAHTAMCKTEKRAVDASTIVRIRDAEVADKCEALGRDLFLFSFYTRGMSFVDMAYLKQGDIAGGYLRYRRQKTGQLIVVKWEPAMEAIVERLRGQCYGQYLLPIISNGRSPERSQYRGCQWKVNRGLRSLGERLGLERRLTMYVARHSWASIARSIGVSVGVISLAMGHTSERTTQIYLKTLDEQAVDQANRSVLELLGGPS